MNISSERVGNATSVDQRNPVLAVWYILLGPAIVVSNAVVMFIIVKWTELRETPTLWAIGFMASFDMCNGLNNIIVGIPSSFLGSYAYGDYSIRGGAIATAFILVQNEFNIALTVMDRFISVQWPLHYSLIATKKKYVTAFVVSIFLNFGRLLSVCIPKFQCYYNGRVGKPLIKINTPVGMATTAVVILCPFFIIFFCSFKIISEVNRVRRRVRILGVSSQDNVGKSTLMIVLSTGLFVLSNVPKLVYTVLMFWLGIDAVPVGFISFCALCVTSHSLWNVFIYTATYKPFRNSLMKTFCQAYYRRQQQTEMGV